jgi:hypothetical protein
MLDVEGMSDVTLTQLSMGVNEYMHIASRRRVRESTTRPCMRGLSPCRSEPWLCIEAFDTLLTLSLRSLFRLLRRSANTFCSVC